MRIIEHVSNGTILLILFILFHPFLSEAENNPNNTYDRSWPANMSKDIAAHLPRDYEPSGIAWHPRLRHLFLVSDEGILSQIDTEGKVISSWNVGGDIEAVTIANPESNYVYLGIEHPDSIVEFDISTGKPTGLIWLLNTWMTGPENEGLEALTFIPNGFHPYTATPSGGVFYAGLQYNGRIYVFNVDLSQNGLVNHVDTITPIKETKDISDLYFSVETGILFAIFDSDNIILEMNPRGKIINQYAFPGNDQEGITLIPDCKLHKAFIFVAEDTGPGLWRFDNYPIHCINTDEQY